MNPNLPENHEPLPADFLREHGAVKGMLCKLKNTDQPWWYSSYDPPQKIDEKDLAGSDYCAPIGTIAAATTPLPEPRCDCGAHWCQPHLLSCSIHRKYVPILPHELVAMETKPEGLMWRDVDPKFQWRDYDGQWPFETDAAFDGVIAYVIPAPTESRTLRYHNPDNLPSAGEPPWRYLNAGEVIRLGDEWQQDWDCPWQPITKDAGVLNTLLDPAMSGNVRTLRPLSTKPETEVKSCTQQSTQTSPSAGAAENLSETARASNAAENVQPVLPPQEQGQWAYSKYRATLKRNGEFFALVTPNGKDALEDKEIVELLNALNGHLSEPQEPTDKEMLDWLEKWISQRGEVEISHNDHDGSRFDRNGHTLLIYRHYERGGTDETLRSALRAAMKGDK